MSPASSSIGWWRGRFILVGTMPRHFRGEVEVAYQRSDPRVFPTTLSFAASGDTTKWPGTSRRWRESGEIGSELTASVLLSRRLAIA